MRFVKASPQLTMRHPPQRLRRLQREQRSGSGRRAKRNHSLNVCVRAGRQSVAGFSPNGGRHRLRFNPRNPIPSPPPSSSQDAGQGPFLRPCDAHQCSYPIFLLALRRPAACLAGDFHVEVDCLELATARAAIFSISGPIFCAAGFHGTSLDREHRRLRRGGRQAHPKHLGQVIG